MNASCAILPLECPATWPPPLMPPTPSHRFHRVPILGWLAAYMTWLRHTEKHQRTMLSPISEEIVRQLNLRPITSGWPVSTEQRQIVKIISDAVCLEKETDFPPALHPEDPCQLLFWGPFDDITPEIIRAELSKQFGFDWPGEFMIRAWHEHWTLQTFVEACDEYRLQNSTPRDIEVCKSGGA